MTYPAAPLATALALAVNADVLRRLRLSCAMTQRDLAIAAGLSRVTIARLEAGKTASTYSVKQLAKALNVDVSTLVQVVEA